jgi:hypothetical protein
VSLVYSGLLFLNFISLFFSFHLRFRDTIALVVSYLARSCDGYVSDGCITSSSAVFVSMSAISFHVMPLCPCTHTKDTFNPSLSNIFLTIRVFGFFVSPLPSIWPSMCLTSQLRLLFLCPCSPYGFYYGFLFGAVNFVLASHSFSYFACRCYYGAGHSSIFSGAVSIYIPLCVLCIFRLMRHSFPSGIFRCLIHLVLS